MNSQELRSLQEAYASVYSSQEVEEGVRDVDPEKGTKERKARLEKKRGMKVDDHPQYKKEEVEQVDEADSLAAMQARREKRLAAQRKREGTTASGRDFGHDYSLSADQQKKRRDAEFKAGLGTKKEEVENVEELYKGKHGQTDKQYADSRSQGGKMVSGDSKMSGAEYTHGRRVKAANPGMQPDVGGKTKPKSQGKMDKGTRADLQYRKAKLKAKNEGFSNWRNELTEVAPMKDEEEKEIKEKKVNNKVTINPELGEEVVSELGGTLIEMVEYDEFDGMVEGVYFELQEEGYGQDDIEEALEWVLTEAKVTYGHDTESPRQQMMKKAKGRLRFLGRKVGEKMASAKKKVGMASAKAQVAGYNKAREVKQSAQDTVNRIKKSASDAPKKAKRGLKSAIKGVAQKVVDRMSEEAEVDPKEKQMLAKKKTMLMKQQMLDKQRMQMQQQGKLPSGHRVEQKEEMSIADQMRISREAAKNRKPFDPEARQKQRAAQMRNAAKNAKKDTRTDAERMADATGPRKGSNYRGD